jgi:hypothetical protein
VHEFRAADRGFTSTFAGFADTGSGRVFIKALHLPSRDEVCFERESAVNPYLAGIAPRLLWSFREVDWFGLGFEAIEGRHPDITPGSADLSAVTRVLNRVTALDLPPVAADWAETRWNAYHPDAERLFAGNALIHSDINPSNILMREAEVALVDWGYPTRGAAYIDAASFVIQLIASGHSPYSAESVVTDLDAWRAADPAALDAFAYATAHLFRRAEERDPVQWRQAMTSAAVGWAEHRGVELHAAPA